jgi:hypothetical protein
MYLRQGLMYMSRQNKSLLYLVRDGGRSSDAAGRGGRAANERNAIRV